MAGGLEQTVKITTMIRNFKKETCPLNDYEKKRVLPILVNILSSRVGSSRAVTSSQFLNVHLKDCPIDAARLRKVINYIRTKGLIQGLMATSRGYYVAETREELEAYLESLQGRENAIKELRRSIRKQMNRLFPVEKE